MASALLVYLEEFADIGAAIQREKSLKRYMRDWRINLIEQSNPQWIDFYPGLLARYG
jgi:putative endonuclease